MDSNIVVAIITSVAGASSSAGVAITALIMNNKRFDLIEKRQDRSEDGFLRSFKRINARLDRIDTRLESIDNRLNELTIDVAKLKMGFHE